MCPEAEAHTMRRTAAAPATPPRDLRRTRTLRSRALGASRAEAHQRADREERDGHRCQHSRRGAGERQDLWVSRDNGRAGNTYRRLITETVPPAAHPESRPHPEVAHSLWQLLLTRATYAFKARSG